MVSEIRQGFRFELRARSTDRRRAKCIAGGCRWVWNEALRLQRAAKERGERMPMYLVLAKQLTAWRAERAWLADLPVHPLQQTLRDLERAWKNCFEKRARAPKPRSKFDKASFRYPDAKQFKIDQANSRLFLPKFGWVRYRASRPIEGRAKNITVSLELDKIFVSIQTEREIDVPSHAGSPVGIDLGVVNLATLSTGERIGAIDALKRHEVRLKRYQRRLARKVKGSKNRRKAVARVARLHRRVANCRSDVLHKTATDLAQRFAVLAIEDLQVKNMTASAAGTTTSPGKNVRQKAGLNRSILAQGFGSFRTLLEYKAARRGGIVLPVPPAYTSQRCSCCGHTAAENRKTQSTFLCVACGHAENADVNAAKNILAAATRPYPGTSGEVTPVRHEKVRLGRSGQEPTEARVAP